MMDFTNINELNQMNVEVDPTSNKTLTDGTSTIATQQDGIFPNSTKTIVGQHTVAETTEGVLGETKILQSGQVSGFMKDGLFGETNLYDNNHQLLGTMDSEGNIKQVLLNTDPLSKANIVNFQELKFNSGE